MGGIEVWTTAPGLAIDVAIGLAIDVGIGLAIDIGIALWITGVVVGYWKPEVWMG